MIVFRFLLALTFICFMGHADLRAAVASKTSYADSSGVQIAYEVRGDGEPLVLIPGFSQSRKAWDQNGFAAAFVAKGYKVVLIDPRGHGESDKPHDPQAYSPKAVSDDVVAVLDDIGAERADLLGYSRGGWIAIATATHHPDRVRSVIAGGAHPYAEDMSMFRTAIADGLGKWIKLIDLRAGPLPEEARSMFLDNDVEALRAAVTYDRGDTSDALLATGVPVLLYAGSNDPRAETARRFAEFEPQAQYLEIPSKDHFQAFFATEPVIETAEQWLRGNGF